MKEELDYIMEMCEKTSERYIEAENLLLEIMCLKWYQRLFIRRKISEFFHSRNKYNF